MNIVYAAEKPSIADVLSDRLRHPIRPQEIEVDDNPDQTGSFLVKWRFRQYVVSPSGEVSQPSAGALDKAVPITAL